MQFLLEVGFDGRDFSSLTRSRKNSEEIFLTRLQLRGNIPHEIETLFLTRLSWEEIFLTRIQF
jgi:hypothetical protein